MEEEEAEVRVRMDVIGSKKKNSWQTNFFLDEIVEFNSKK